jgi:KDO2-lipid IV(A) lauroyltransferase
MTMKRPRHPALNYLIYLVVRLIVCIAQAVSIERSYAFARLLAALMYRVDTRHRRVGLENVRLAFGDRLSEAECDAMVRGVYLHFCTMLMEMVHIPRKVHLTNWRDRVRLVNFEPILDRLLDGGPMILVTGHFGNWEMAGYLFGLFGFPTHSVYRPLDNPYLDRFLHRFRGRTGQRLIPKEGGYDQMLDVIHHGGILGFLADQDAGQRGMFVEFFGRPASTHKAIALLAIQHRAPVVVGYARRVGADFRYEVGAAEVILPEEFSGTADDARLLTRRFTAALEKAIRRDPGQYLWLHRRWKHRPKARKEMMSRVDGAHEGPTRP